MKASDADRDGTLEGAIHRWEMPFWWRPFMIGILVLLLVFGALVAPRVVSEGWQAMVFMTVWFAALAWNLYWWLFRIPYRLEVRGETLYWRAPFARGDLPVPSIIDVGPFLGLSYQITVIRAVGHRSVPLFACGDLSWLFARLSAINSAVPARVPGFAGAYDRLSGRMMTPRQRRLSRGARR
ncbi:hypothetical protein [Agromyces allii]|uniref:PH domain-containing protein n=1 Tax=Agromyces allii TaxID=393607 RepID=A0ABN2R6U5_9MICO|nr:hypothetical protein [Agromyces allii]